MRLRARGLRAASLAVALAAGLAACSPTRGPEPPPGPTTTTTTTAGSSHRTTTTSLSTTTTSATTTTTVPTTNVVTFAERPGLAPDYIAPITPSAYAYPANTAQFSSLMYRPLVWPGSGTTLGPNTAKSLYSSIHYNRADTSVTITLKAWQWSDGAPVTARDITFFLNLVKANASQWSGSVAGEIPDNIETATVTGPRTLVLKLKGAWSPFWFTDNELSLLTPLPQHVWDKTSPTSKVGSYDLTTTGARSVWSFVTGQAKLTATFATNPLWRVVDGPWTLKSFDTTGVNAGKATFLPNPAYSGSDKAALAQFVELPFANSTMEVDALAAGKVDVGYLPSDLLADRPVLDNAGFSLSAWRGLGLDGIIPNLANPKVGPILAQTYVRQALRQLVDQGAMIDSTFGGFASPANGPVPLDPADPFASPAEMANPYPFSVSAATATLTSHGWQEGAPGSPDVCKGPCGRGIAVGQSLALTLSYPAGDPKLAAEMEVFKTAAITAGVVIDLQPVSAQTYASTVTSCPSSCNWELATYEGYPFKVLPSGEGLFVKGSRLDIGGFASTTNTANVAATLHDPSPSAFYTYENYLVTQVPWIWLPSPAYQLTEVASTLSGVTPQNAYLYLDPEDWSYSSP